MPTVVAFTAEAISDAHEKIKETGFAGSLQKPFQKEALQSFIESVESQK